MRLATYRAVRFPNVSVGLMRDVLIEHGLDEIAAFRDAGIHPSVADVAGSALAGPQELAFQSAFARLTADRPELWTKLGLRYRLTTLRASGFAMMTAPTIQDWASAAAESSDVIYSMTEITAHHDDGIVTGLTFDYTTAPSDVVPFSVHRDLAAILAALDELWGGPFPLDRIGIPLPDLDPQLTERTGAVMDFDTAVLRLEWSPESSTRRLPHANELQYETFLAEARHFALQFQLGGDWTEVVMAVLRGSSPIVADASTLARTLNMSVRTLQRQLRTMDVTFRVLRDRVRSEIAREALTDSNVSIASLARRLGYAEPTAFTTAFRRWTGSSPTEFRADPSRIQQPNHSGYRGPAIDPPTPGPQSPVREVRSS